MEDVSRERLDPEDIANQLIIGLHSQVGADRRKALEQICKFSARNEMFAALLVDKDVLNPLLSIVRDQIDSENLQIAVEAIGHLAASDRTKVHIAQNCGLRPIVQLQRLGGPGGVAAEETLRILCRHKDINDEILELKKFIEKTEGPTKGWGNAHFATREEYENR